MWGSAMAPAAGLYQPQAANSYLQQQYVMPVEGYHSVPFWNGYTEPPKVNSLYAQPPTDGQAQHHNHNGYPSEEAKWTQPQMPTHPNNYVKWGENTARPENAEPHQPEQSQNGTRYLESWEETTRNEKEMSGRQRKKELYGMGGAWAREDFFRRLPPTHCPFGAKVLRGMGWRQGQALGKSMEGHTAPIAVDVRFGRQGLCTKEERDKFFNTGGGGGRPKPAKKAHPVKNLNGKHPVSLLAEHCVKRQVDMPKYEVVFEYGNVHSRSVLVSVTVAGRTFEPSQPSPYKKHGKAAAATLALKELGFETGI